MRLLQDFAGDWTLTRQIVDHTGGPPARFDGTARFVIAGPGTLRLEERGVMRLGDGPTMQAERAYLWHDDSAGGVAVFFDDGRPFHGIDLARSKPIASHDCAPDLYDVAYDFADWPVWQMRWRVRGPRKDYTSLSLFGR